MDLKQLINYVNNKAFTTPEDELFVFGRFGYVRAKASGLSRYTVDSNYRKEGINVLIKQQEGFRLSTLCCLCAGVLFGEQALDYCLINSISDQL